MASQERNETRHLALFQALREKPYGFSFLHAMRLLESAFPDKPRLGAAARPADEPIRLGQEPTLAFPASTLASFQQSGTGRVPPRLDVFFMGLFGPNGPLPLHLTEYARERSLQHQDDTIARFADVFHHRMLLFFYRVWAASQPAVSYDRPDDDRFAVYLGSLFGLGSPGVRNRDRLPDLAKLFYAGHFACQSRHADGLQAMIGNFFGMPVEISQFVGHWITLSEESMTRLGESPETGALGLTAVIGSRVWDCQHKFRIIIGPVGYADYQRLLPGGDSLPRLVDMVRNYTEEGLSWDLKIILKKEEVPPLKLGEAGQLGWTTWSTTMPLEKDADDLELDAVSYLSRA